MQYPVNGSTSGNSEEVLSSRKSSTVMASKRGPKTNPVNALTIQGGAVKPMPIAITENLSYKKNNPIELVIDGLPEPILSQESRRTPNPRPTMATTSQ